MVVDGSADVRRVIRQIVGGVADDIHECATPLDAFAAYGRVRPDVVVMDLGMPPCDGIWATRQIVGLHPQAVIVLVAPFPDAMFRATADRAGARGFVLKENLFDLRQWLAGWASESLKGERT
jgi:two-component system, NarL family, invasion response regulator UvrY